MSNNSESSSKRKREKKSILEPEEIRRSARQKGNNQIPIIQRAMNLKRANSLESDSLNSTQNHRQDVSRGINQSCMGGLHHSFSQAAQPVQCAPNITSLHSQMMSSDTSQRDFHFTIADSGNQTNEAPQAHNSAPIVWNMQANIQASSYYRMLLSQHDSSQRVDHPVMADLCNPIYGAPQPSSYSPIDQSMQTLSYSQMLASQNDAVGRFDQSHMAGFIPSINQATQPQPVQFVPWLTSINSQMMSSDSSQRVNHPFMADPCSPAKEAQPSSNGPIDQNAPTSLYNQVLSSQRDASRCRQNSIIPVVDPTPDAIPVHQMYSNVGAHSSQRNNYPVSDFVGHELNIRNRQSRMNFQELDDSATFNSQTNYSLTGDGSFTTAAQCCLGNTVNPDAAPHSSENNSINNGRRNLSSIAHSDYDAIFRSQLEAEFRRSLDVQDQPQRMAEPNRLMKTKSLDPRKRKTDAKRVKRTHKQEQSVQPVITDYIRMEGGNPFTQSPPPPKPLGERCQLCKIDLAFKARGADPESSNLPFSAVLPCRHVFHDQCLKDFFGDAEPPCVECLDSQVPRGC